MVSVLVPRKAVSMFKVVCASLWTHLCVGRETAMVHSASEKWCDVLACVGCQGSIS